MGDLVQLVITALLVALAVGYFARRTLAATRGESGCGKCGGGATGAAGCSSLSAHGSRPDRNA